MPPFTTLPQETQIKLLTLLGRPANSQIIAVHPQFLGLPTSAASATSAIKEHISVWLDYTGHTLSSLVLVVEEHRASIELPDILITAKPCSLSKASTWGDRTEH